jgi:hypothetical protein
MRPSRVALWLVGQFALPDRREAILGDLQEEFAVVATKAGITRARRWWWWQTARTLGHLIAAGIRESPARLFLSVAAGFILWWNVPIVVEEAVVGIHNRWQVYQYIDAYTFWLISYVLVHNIFAPALIGSLLALSNKERECIASTGLAAAVLAWTGGSLIQHVFAQQNLVRQNPGLSPLWHFFTMMQIQIALCALLTGLSLVIGGLIVRKARFAVAIRPVGA